MTLNRLRAFAATALLLAALRIRRPTAKRRLRSAASDIDRRNGRTKHPDRRAGPHLSPAPTHRIAALRYRNDVLSNFR